MSFLTELLNEVKDELLQEEWDRELLRAFRHGQYPITGIVVDRFRAKHKLTREQFKELKRVPRYARHFDTRIPRFIAAYLPSLNDKLYASNLSDDDLIKWMNKVNLDVESRPADNQKAAADLSVRSKTIIRATISHMEAALARENNDLYNRKWSTVKAVRSKS